MSVASFHRFNKVLRTKNIIPLTSGDVAIGASDSKFLDVYSTNLRSSTVFADTKVEAKAVDLKDGGASYITADSTGVWTSGKVRAGSNVELDATTGAAKATAVHVGGTGAGSHIKLQVPTGTWSAYNVSLPSSAPAVTGQVLKVASLSGSDVGLSWATDEPGSISGTFANNTSLVDVYTLTFTGSGAVLVKILAATLYGTTGDDAEIQDSTHVLIVGDTPSKVDVFDYAAVLTHQSWIPTGSASSKVFKLQHQNKAGGAKYFLKVDVAPIGFTGTYTVS